VTFKFEHVSPSQIETWLGCQRQWYWEKVMGLVKPPSEGNITGSACHAVIEDVILERNGEDLTLRSGTDRKDGKDRYRTIVRPALPVLLRQRDQVRAGTGHVERNMKRKLRNGLDLIGRIDFIDLGTDVPLVDDHKTTKDAQYIKTEEELRTNIQMLAYAYEAVCLKPLATGVRVAHNVMLTRGAPTARYTDVVIPRQEIHAGWTRIQDISDKMIETSKLASPADVPPTESACSNFGGCFHRDRCAAIKAAKSGQPAPSPYDGISSSITQETPMSSTTALPAHILAKLTGGKTPPAPAAAPVAAAPVAPPPTTALPAALQNVLKQQAAPAAAPPRAALLPPEAPMNPRDAKAQAAQLAASAPVGVAREVEGNTATVVLEGAALLQSLGWADAEIDALTEEMFEATVAGRWKREDCEIGFAAPEADGFQAIDRVSPTATKIQPVAPVRRSRVAAAAPVTVEVQPATKAWYHHPAAGEKYILLTEAEAAEARQHNDWEYVGDDAAKATHEKANAPTPVEVQAEAPKRRGRPPGSKNKVAAEPAPAVAQDPVVAALTEEAGEAAAEAELAQVVAGEREAAAMLPAEMAHDRIEELTALALRQQAQEVAYCERIAALEEQGAYREGVIAELQKALAREEALHAAGPDADKFVLYIDCLPETPGVSYRTLDAVLAPFMALAAQNYKNSKTGVVEPLSHYALIPFNAGPGAVAAYVLTNLDKVVTPGILYVDTTSPCAAAVLEVLRPKADLIVRRTGR
jgi:hypothetical protein